MPSFTFVVISSPLYLQFVYFIGGKILNPAFDPDTSTVIDMLEPSTKTALAF